MDQQLSFVVRPHQHQVRTQCLAVLWLFNFSLQRRRDLLAFDNRIIVLERVAQHPSHPLRMNGRIGFEAVLIILPFLMDLPQQSKVLRIVRI